MRWIPIHRELVPNFVIVEFMDYSNYSLEDFVQDKDFRNWVLSGNPETDAFWHQWMENNPTKAPLILEARAMVRGLKFREYKLDSHRKSALWDSIEQRIDNPAFKIHPTKYIDSNRYTFRKSTDNWFLKFTVAATISLFLIIVVYRYIQNDNDQMEIYQTGFSETLELVLWDGTEVVLNANSMIKIPNRRVEGGVREVWLTGEAFFDVARSDLYKEFIVHTELIDVLVLGTKFNVFTRGRRSFVELASGKVMLTNPVTNTRIEMEPGDHVLYETEFSQPVIRKIDTDEVSAWRENLLIFRRTSLDEIAALLKSNYNLELIFTDRRTANHYFTGTVPSDNLELLFTTLARTFDLEIEYMGNTIVIKPREERP